MAKQPKTFKKKKRPPRALTGVQYGSRNDWRMRVRHTIVRAKGELFYIEDVVEDRNTPNEMTARLSEAETKYHNFAMRGADPTETAAALKAYREIQREMEACPSTILAMGYFLKTEGRKPPVSYTHLTLPTKA